MVPLPLTVLQPLLWFLCQWRQSLILICRLSAFDQIRLALFAVLFFQTALAGLTFRLWEEANGFQNQVADWFQCLFTQNDTSTCVKPFVPVVRLPLPLLIPGSPVLGLPLFLQKSFLHSTVVFLDSPFLETFSFLLGQKSKFLPPFSPSTMTKAHFSCLGIVLVVINQFCTDWNLCFHYFWITQQTCILCMVFCYKKSY